jgi:hypothetical protein
MGNQVLSTIKYVAGTKPVFLLSEIALYLDTPMTPGRIYGEIEPHLKELGLSATHKGSDYEISRIPKTAPYILNDRENTAIETYLGNMALPSWVDTAIEGYIAKKTGKDLTDPVILDRLRHAIVAQKDDYWKPTAQRTLQYTKGYAVLGYLAYHFPVYFMQFRHLLALLARQGLLKNRMTILDLGTGPGVVPLALADFWRLLDTATTDVYSLEQSKEHIEAFQALARALPHDGNQAVIRPPVETDLTSLQENAFPGSVDLLVCSNVLNELAALPLQKRADILMSYAERLAPEGTILIIEPAEESSSIGLRSLSLALKKRGLSIYAPCSFIWNTNCTPDRCWSFTTAPAIRPTHLMTVLADCSESFRYINTDIKFSYVILRKEAKTPISCLPQGIKAMRLSRIHLNEGRRVTIVAAKMSGELGGGKTHVVKICDGSATKPVYAVLPAFHCTQDTRELLAAPYGAILVFEEVIVKYNPAHDSYNVLANRTSTIKQMS